MTSQGNVAAKQSGKEVEGNDGVKTLECLRGRLLAERAVSRAANEEADKLGNKLTELENKLKEEVKLRKIAEKRLRSLIKKLEAMKIVHVVSDESSSDHSSPLGQSDLGFSSSSSTASSFSYSDKQNKKPNSPNRNDKAVKKDGSTCSEILKHTDVDSGASSDNQSFTSSKEISSDKTISEKSDEHSQCTQFNYDEKLDDHRSKSSVEDEKNNGENHHDWDETSVDNSMALVAVDIQASRKTTPPTIEPLIAENSGVKDVLDTLRYVKEGLQSSTGRRHMIRVGY